MPRENVWTITEHSARNFKFSPDERKADQNQV